MTITLTGTLSRLKAFGTIITIKFVLIQNMFWFSIFLRQSNVWCLALEQNNAWIL
jgi:hypothetical protein